MSAEAPRVGAYLAASDERGRVLLVKMRGGPFVGEWLLPGGGLEPGESPEDAVRREVREETGTEVVELAPAGRYEVRGVRQPGFHFHMHAFRGRVRGEPRAEAGSEVRWQDPRAFEPHPVLARELGDAGLRNVDRDGLRRSAWLDHGVLMTRLGPDGEDRAWYDEVRECLESAYLSAADEAAGSGKGGGMARWELGRKPIASAVDRSGTFLDVGCANGLLMSSLARWAAERGHHLEPYGLDISERIAETARARHPEWRDRIFVGNALGWHPPRRFDLVRTELEYVPRYRTPDLVAHLVQTVVEPRGRLIVCGYGTDRAEAVGDTLRRWGHAVSGECEGRDLQGRVLVRIAWIDRV